MKEHPILFSAPMVRAILEGRKSQTRRVVKPQRDRELGCELAPNELAGEVNRGDYSNAPWHPGDLLWVRETFQDARHAAAGRVLYRASGDIACGWKPSIFMPRDASRITLSVSGVRIERLNNISRSDAVSEGVQSLASSDGPNYWTVDAGDVHLNSPTAQGAYAMLWDWINGPGSWEANPWVWVIEFRRVAA